MGNSRKSRSGSRKPFDLASHVARNIADVVGRGDRVVVALSGGVDSVVLLDLVTRLAKRRRFSVTALHVNHQISPNAAHWAAFCREVCRALPVPLRVVRVRVERGNSLEAAAREARYAVLGSQAADCVVLAHNQDDQAETLLLQLLRGAGIKGLSAMPVLRTRPAAAPENARSASGPVFLRPMLDVPRRVIAAYARRRGLEWVEDESNEDTYYLRNFLRHEVLPLIGKRFPSYRTTLSRAARHFAETSQMIADLAARDGAGFRSSDSLQVAALRKLTNVRARNLLRHFLASRGVAMPGARRLAEALRQALGAREDAAVCIGLGGFELRRFDGALRVVAGMPAVAENFSRAWRGERELAVPELRGTLSMVESRGKGISLSRLRSQPVTIRVRRGAERLRPDPSRPRRLLKKLLQESRIPPWQRDRLPLLYCGSDLVWVPGIGIAGDYQARKDEPSMEPRWTLPTGESVAA